MLDIMDARTQNQQSYHSVTNFTGNCFSLLNYFSCLLKQKSPNDVPFLLGIWKHKDNFSNMNITAFWKNIAWK